MHIDILSLFPEYFSSPFKVSMIKRAIEKGIVTINCIDIRDFANNKHKKVDDRPFGGGPGMVLCAQPVMDAIRSIKKEGTKVIYLSPQGRLLQANKSRDLSKNSHLILLCGHYEGIDNRILSEVDEEISIGDYVLTSGCPAAVVLVDTVLRYIPGVLGHPEGAQKETFEQGVFEGPHYTRPFEYEGKKVPEVLLNGNHKEIEKWRTDQGVKKTKDIRPDLIGQKSKEKSCES